MLRKTKYIMKTKKTSIYAEVFTVIDCHVLIVLYSFNGIGNLLNAMSQSKDADKFAKAQYRIQ